MPGFMPGIHVLAAPHLSKTWMAGINPAMTNESLSAATAQLKARTLSRFCIALTANAIFSFLSNSSSHLSKFVRDVAFSFRQRRPRMSRDAFLLACLKSIK